MKKMLILALVGAALLLSACSGQGASSTAISNSPASTTASSLPLNSAQASSKTTEDMIAGNVDDATMNTLQLMTVDGHIFLFATEGVTIEAANGVVIGDDVEVYYTGTLDENKQVQDVTIHKIVVTTP